MVVHLEATVRRKFELHTNRKRVTLTWVFAIGHYRRRQLASGQDLGHR